MLIEFLQEIGFNNSTFDKFYITREQFSRLITFDIDIWFDPIKRVPILQDKNQEKVIRGILCVNFDRPISENLQALDKALQATTESFSIGRLFGREIVAM